MKASSTRVAAIGALLVLATTQPAHAYVDPGIGSILLQGLVAAAVGGLVFFRSLRESIGSFLGRLFGRDGAAGTATGKTDTETDAETDGRDDRP